MQSQSARLPLPAPRRTRRCAREVEYRPRAKRPTLNLRVPLFCCLLIALVASAAYAEGINLSWNDCGFSGGENRNFACNSNFGENVMVASFDPPSGITKLVGSSATLELQTTSTPLPSWWQLASGGCREGALRLELAAPASPNCVDYWSSAATGSFSYVGGGAANRARITVSFGIPEAGRSGGRWDRVLRVSAHLQQREVCGRGVVSRLLRPHVHSSDLDLALPAAGCRRSTVQSAHAQLGDLAAHHSRVSGRA